MNFRVAAPLDSQLAHRGFQRSVAFCLLTFALTWPVEAAAALSKLGIINVKIPGGIQMLAALSPGIAAIVLSFRRFGGAGTRKFLRSLLQWRVKPSIYAAAGLFSFGGCFVAYELITRLGLKASSLTSPFDLLMYFCLYFRSVRCGKRRGGAVSSFPR